MSADSDFSREYVTQLFWTCKGIAELFDSSSGRFAPIGESSPSQALKAPIREPQAPIQPQVRPGTLRSEQVKDLLWACRGIAEAFHSTGGRFSASGKLRPSKLEPIQEVDSTSSKWTKSIPEFGGSCKEPQAAVAKARGVKGVKGKRRPRPCNAHFQVFKGMPPPPPLPSAARSRSCRPAPSPWGATAIQQPPWNQRRPQGQERPVEPADTTAADVAAQVAAQRAEAWQPWLVSAMKTRIEELVPPRERRERRASEESEVVMKSPSSPSFAGAFSASCSPSFRSRMRSNTETSMMLESDVVQSLKSTFDKVFGDKNATSPTSPPNRGGESVPLWQMHKLAPEMNMTLQGVLQAKEIFDHHDGDGSGRLSFDEIIKVIETLMEEQVPDEDTVKNRIQSGQTKQLLNSWLRFVPHGLFDLNFEDFLVWYSCTGFMTDLLVDDKEKRMRNLAKLNGLDALCMDRVRRSFAAFDLDNSGEVDEEEFENVLREVMSIPPNLSIPRSRIRFFWREIDEDESGKATFVEFLNFWMRRFGQSSGTGQLISIEDYYRSTRRMGEEYLDPPAELDEITKAVERFVSMLEE